MASEKYANNASTTLNGAITNSVTSLVVTSATGFPSTGQFRIMIDSEILIVTSVSGTTYTVTRGAEGTTATSHLDLAPITQILTKGALDQIISDNCQDVAYASLPSAEKAGRLIFVNDGVKMFRDNGSTLDAYAFGPKLTKPPTVSNFTWDNQGIATAVDVNDTIFMSYTSSGSILNQVVGLHKSAPSPPYKITVKAAYDIAPQNYGGWGLYFRESSSGKIASFVILQTGPTAYLRKWNNATSFSADYTIFPQSYQPWVQIADDNTNRICSVSADGINWKVIHSIGRTDFMTADQVGICINPEKPSGGSTVTNTITLLSWLEH